jgi:hypothetical protein
MGPPPGPGAASAGGPRRRGTPKIVPIVVSAGLAVGTFCGLLFGVGTGGGSSTAGAAPGSDAGAAVVQAAPIDAGAVAVAAFDAAPPPPDAGAGVVQIDAALAAVKVVITFKVVPAVPTEITVDGEKVVGTTHEVVLEDGARTVKIVAKAKGFRIHEKEFAVTKDMVVPIALKKRGDGPSPQGPSGPIIDL